MSATSIVDSGEGADTRVSTGVAGLDAILAGGLPPGHLYLLEGTPGTGKTTVALQFLLAGAAKGQRGVYVTLSETRRELTEVALSHGWSLTDIDVIELSADEGAASDELYTVFHPAELELQQTMSAVLEAIDRSQPSLVVLDSLSEMRLLARDPLRFRRQILALKHFFTGRQATVLLLDDKSAVKGTSNSTVSRTASSFSSMSRWSTAPSGADCT